MRHLPFSPAMSQLHAELSHRVLMLDGGMGTMIQQYKLSEADFRGERFKNHSHDLKGNNDLLALTRPDVVKAIHKNYLKSGADIIETNTFNGTSIAQADYHLQSVVRDLNIAAKSRPKKKAGVVSLRALLDPLIKRRLSRQT